MGGDFGPHSIVPACISALAESPSLRLALVGDISSIEHILSRHPGVDRSRLKIVHACEVVTMDEPPAQALRGKPDSSMRIALELVQKGEAAACVSAGNTGALMALSRHILRTLPGIDRPAMITEVPSSNGRCHLLDLGANIDCSAEHLYQFAVMGAVAAEVQGVKTPRVALLNVGTEEIKGTAQVKQAATLLREADAINFIGYIEGDGLYRGDADVVVCDGFVGNIVLKSSEGLAGLVITRIKAAFQKNAWTRLVGILAMPFFKRLQHELSPEHRNGASLLGLQGIVVKSHGAAGPEGFASAIRYAWQAVQEDLPQRLRGRLEQILNVSEDNS